MSSKSSHNKHRNRSRSRSPHDRHYRKERSHRTDKHHDKREQERSRGEEVAPRKIKEEPADKGYRKYENARETERTASHANKRVERNRDRDGRDVTRGGQPVQIKQERDRNDDRRRENRRQREDENPFWQQGADGGGRQGPQGQGGNEEGEEGDGEPPAPKEGPNFGLSGALTEDTNTFRGIVIKYNEPPEARKPKLRWRLYVFKGDEEMPTLYIHRQSAFLLGRERLIADLPIDHPSCSKQHAAIQYRLVDYKKADGTMGRRVRPYIIDLESANGTFLNNKQIDPKRYYELQEKDVLKFGFSSREYVVLHEKTSTAELSDDGEDD